MDNIVKLVLISLPIEQLCLILYARVIYGYPSFIQVNSPLQI